MKTKLGSWMMAYGLFLIAMGVAGFASNPERAKTALISGGIFGGLSVGWGWLMTRGLAWTRWAAGVTTGMLTGVFCWRATVSWAAYAGGAADKLVAATLITLMGIASVLMLAALVRGGGSDLKTEGMGNAD